MANPLPAIPDSTELIRFYDEAYTSDAAAALQGGRWRALSAVGKAEHVISLCAQGGLEPLSTLEVGCGDGALLCELRRRAFGGRLAGAEITAAAVALARERPEIDTVELYDGKRLPMAARAYDLGVLSHVLEHVPDPPLLLAEVARVCAAVVVEVPLEDNLSARRPGKREHAAEVGHLQRLRRSSLHEIAARANLRVVAELEDPLGLEVHRFFAYTPFARARAGVKWALRAALHRLAPSVAKRLFTVHYACLCIPMDDRSPVR